MVKVAVGCPSYNGAERLDYLLHSIFKGYASKKGKEWFTREGTFSLVVLDDGTPPTGARRIRQVCDKWSVELIAHDENVGIAKSWNDLTRHFDSEFMVLLNDDVIVCRDWLKAMAFFLENNKCGGVSLPFYFAETQDIPRILAGEIVTPRDPLTKQPAPHKRGEIHEEITPGRIMCASGNIHGFKRELFDKIGGFDEKHFRSFFEESDFYTSLASLGYSSYGLTYPTDCWHVWSQTFRENPELEAGQTMMRSHQAYIEKWQVPKEYWSMPFDYTNPIYMSRIPRQKITWLGANGKVYEGWDS